MKRKTLSCIVIILAVLLLSSCRLSIGDRIDKHKNENTVKGKFSYYLDHTLGSDRYEIESITQEVATGMFGGEYLEDCFQTEVIVDGAVYSYKVRTDEYFNIERVYTDRNWDRIKNEMEGMIRSCPGFENMDQCYINVVSAQGDRMILDEMVSVKELMSSHEFSCDVYVQAAFCSHPDFLPENFDVLGFCKKFYGESMVINNSISLSVYNLKEKVPEDRLVDGEIPKDIAFEEIAYKTDYFESGSNRYTIGANHSRQDVIELGDFNLVYLDKYFDVKALQSGDQLTVTVDRAAKPKPPKEDRIVALKGDYRLKIREADRCSVSLYHNKPMLGKSVLYQDNQHDLMNPGYILVFNFDYLEKDHDQAIMTICDNVSP